MCQKKSNMVLKFHMSTEGDTLEHNLDPYATISVFTQRERERGGGGGGAAGGTTLWIRQPKPTEPQEFDRRLWHKGGTLDVSARKSRRN